MKKLLTSFLLGLLLLAGCENTRKYRFTIIDTDRTVLSKHKDRYSAGEAIRIETVMLTDVIVSMYVNDEFYNNATTAENNVGQSVFVYDFIMPTYDVTITFVIKDGMIVEPNYIDITFIQRKIVDWQNFEDYLIPVFGEEDLTITTLSFEDNIKLTLEEIDDLQSRSVLNYIPPETMYGYYIFYGFYFDEENTNDLHRLTPEFAVTLYNTYYYGLAG
ncbi:MAG TPA: hypothetical protein PK460_01820 [Bacilli bacterium]|nr:hypothetical protein [Bacilli bacterium]HOQ70425.1 hypothetical protein [Bacilli bacterium]